MPKRCSTTEGKAHGAAPNRHPRKPLITKKGRLTCYFSLTSAVGSSLLRGKCKDNGWSIWTELPLLDLNRAISLAHYLRRVTLRNPCVAEPSS